MWKRCAAALWVGLTLPTAATACSCFAPSAEAAWYHNSDLVTVHITASKTRGMYRYFLAEVSEVYQGCSTDRELVVLSTHMEGALCGGAILAVGTEYLVETYPTDRVIKGRYRELSYSLCGLTKAVDTVSEEEWGFLNSRMVTCADTGEVSCVTDDVVECLVDPCETAPDCPEGTCVSNTCGSCTYEFYDWIGEQVCKDL
jgi:hypothetical protein